MHSGNTSRAVACTLAALAIGGCAQFAKVTDPELTFVEEPAPATGA